MSDDRRFSDEEVGEILDLAARDVLHPRSLAADGGLTLAEIQEIANEAGIDPRRVVDAANAIVDKAERLPRQGFLSMPVSTGLIAGLPRSLSDHEWEVLVADLRTTFGAPGEVGGQGDTREWRNGALRVFLEPTPSGQQLRLTTTNRRLRSLASIGVVELVAGLVFLAILLPRMLEAGAWSWGAIQALLPAIIVTLGGAGFVGWSWLELPQWAAERERQMEDIILRARALASAPPDDDPGA